MDIQELRRIFDNLASNIRKYAQPSAPIVLQVLEKEGRVCIFQSNTCKTLFEPVESNGIGLLKSEKSKNLIIEALKMIDFSAYK